MAKKTAPAPEVEPTNQGPLPEAPTQRYFQRTFHKAHPGVPQGLTSSVLGGFTSALYEQAREEGLEPDGDAHVYGQTNEVGSHTDVTLRVKVQSKA